MVVTIPPDRLGAQKLDISCRLDGAPFDLCEHLRMMSDADFMNESIKIGDEDLDRIVSQARGRSDLGGQVMVNKRSQRQRGDRISRVLEVPLNARPWGRQRHGVIVHGGSGERRSRRRGSRHVHGGRRENGRAKVKWQGSKRFIISFRWRKA